MKDPYKILGVDKSASADEIKKAYRKLALQHHPDRGGDEDTFKSIAESYDILSDPKKKSNFDNFGDVNGGSPFGSNPFGGGSGNPFGGFDDFIANMFGGGDPFARQRARQGSDVLVKVQMTLIDILKGANKKIKFTRNVKCDTCDGKGGANANKCTSCDGKGQRINIQNTQFGQIQQVVACNDCRGEGWIIPIPCTTCNGSGAVSKNEEITITVPPGVSNNAVFTIHGSGSYAKNGVFGHLNIRIEEIEDKDFKRGTDERFNDLQHEIWVSITEAVFGARKTVKYPLGDLQFDVNPGCESGKEFTFKGKGIPNVGDGGRIYGSGDLNVKVNVIIPKVLTEEAKAAFEVLKNYE